jgi:hypothetical protein
VPIYYESRLVDLGLDDETKKWMDEEADALLEGVDFDRINDYCTRELLAPGRRPVGFVA